MAFTGPRADREDIRELYDTYSDTSMRGDTEGFLSLFTEEAQWNTHHFRRQGKADLRAQWDALWQGFDKVGFFAQICAIEVDGDTAQCRSMASETIRLKDANVYKLVGHYRDQLVRQNGRWLFAVRDYEPVWEEAPGS